MLRAAALTEVHPPGGRPESPTFPPPGTPSLHLHGAELGWRWPREWSQELTRGGSSFVRIFPAPLGHACENLAPTGGSCSWEMTVALNEVGSSLTTPNARVKTPRSS